MLLSEVHAVLGLGPYEGSSDPNVLDITQDSRDVQANWMFACVSGGTSDGHDFAGTAVTGGATALLVERNLNLGVPELLVSDTRSAMATAASILHGSPSKHMRIVGVTGTSGKTTVTALLGQLLNLLGKSTTVLGTLSGARTTPESPRLQRQLGEWADQGVDAVAMEVSSHALMQHRVDAVSFDVAVFLNLSPEHLDYHHDMEGYYAAKRLLFSIHEVAHYLVCVDDSWGRRLADDLGDSAVAFGMDQLEDVHSTAVGSSFIWRDQTTGISMPGAFNVANAQAAAEAAMLLGYEPSQIAPLLPELVPVPGRLEPVNEGQAFDVIVDYAHKPAALELVLGEARAIAEGHVHVVLGCGGDRDRMKRPAMGRIAAELGDVVYLTSDNPRGESAEVIISEILAGVPASGRNAVLIEVDRAAAIRLAIENAVAGDVVIIAGKGHETTQTFVDRIVHFDDREVARSVLREMMEEAP